VHTTENGKETHKIELNTIPRTDDLCGAVAKLPDHTAFVARKNRDSSRSAEALSRARRSLTVPIFLGLLCLLVYNANLRQIGAGDTLPARYLPLNIWRYGTLELDPIARWVANGHAITSPRDRPSTDSAAGNYLQPWAYWMIRNHQHHLVSLYPVVAPVLIAPLYLPAVAYLHTRGWKQPEVDRVAEIMEKLSASILAAGASILVYLLLRRDGFRWSLGLALAFAFGTNTWMISSQALWQHGAGELLIALALLLTVLVATPARLAALGAVCVAIAANRPPDALIAGAIVLCILWTQGRNAVWLLAGAAPPLAAVLYYNLGVIGNIAGGYGIIAAGAAQSFHDSIWSAVAGLLISPGRGLLIFSPFLIFLPLGLWQRLRTKATRGLAIALAAAVVAQLFVYAKVDWRAGASWGPRFLTDLLPVAVWMLAPASLGLRLLGRSVLILTMIASVGVQAIGAFWYTKTSDDAIFAGDRTSMKGAWDFANVPFLAELRHPRARGQLQCEAAASIDRIGTTMHVTAAETPLILRPGDVLEGWAVACGRAPTQLILLIDGIVIGSTKDFLPQSEVEVPMPANSGSGWRISATTDGVEPGERMLQLGIQIEPRSHIRIVHEQPVIVMAQQPVKANEAWVSPSVLNAMATHAASMLRDRQSAEGYWLTSYTAEPRFEAAHPEMNTFLTAMMVDFLSPVARARGLDDAMERARAHLGAQIESDGLVRYHGRPDGPTIGKLGCAITPDADDTALAWRIVRPGASDPRRQKMLDELARYRDARGLYRTWLAPRDRYQCLDPGNDPNPADATIQMHMYMMMRELDPATASRLCRALERHIGDKDLWVYYADAPLVPFLRGAELRQQGCAIPLLTDRLARPAAGQEIWSEVARRLERMMTSSPSPNDKRAIGDLLARLGRDDFAELRRTPPLLYHNDQTAKVPRYYWSEDFGYALWLRLYDAARMDAESLARSSQ